ncbi:organomercurial lyase [Streptomyces atratus]|uniref:organomercurial lyase n=1 Tax=Streptomyces atratus TaxID=1893 RepID=UPI00227D7EB3|nr:organomercurial lyase [Streptomyces atratus]WPW26478.1 organomercurial lyase [Streptomyces atratus]
MAGGGGGGAGRGAPGGGCRALGHDRFGYRADRRCRPVRGDRGTIKHVAPPVQARRRPHRRGIEHAGPASGPRGPVPPPPATSAAAQTSCARSGATAEAAVPQLAAVCCDALNFFTSEASARRWADGHRDVTGDVVDQERAADIGQQTVGPLLTDG